MQGGFIYTTDYIFDETFALFFKRLSSHQAQESMKLLLELVKEEELKIEFITPKRFADIVALRIKFEDKPQISFTDLSSIMVMKELSISKILTADAHFGHVGMNF